jgi:hypothetical protein
MSERFVRTCWVGLVALVLVAMSAAGCATVPMATKENSAHWKATSPAPGTALVYLYRNETLGYAIHMDVELDGKFWGQTVSKSYMIWQLRPGRHRLLSKAENDSELVLNVLPGGRYYVWQEVKMGLMSARSQLQEVSPVTGQSGLDECQLIEMPLPPPPSRQPPPPAPAATPAAPLAGTAPPTS